MTLDLAEIERLTNAAAQNKQYASETGDHRWHLDACLRLAEWVPALVARVRGLEAQVESLEKAIQND